MIDYESLIAKGASAIAAIATMWAAIQAQRSAGAAKNSVQVTKENILETTNIGRKQARAYLALDGITGSQGIFPNQPVLMSFNLKNVGNTPAFNVQTAFVINSSSKFPTEKKIDDAMGTPRNCGTIAPSIVHPIKVFTDDNGYPYILNTEQIVEINKEKNYFSVCGIATYDDAFGDHHETKFGQHYYSDEHAFNAAPYYSSMT
jgi:hypothetical protein